LGHFLDHTEVVLTVDTIHECVCIDVYLLSNTDHISIVLLGCDFRGEKESRARKTWLLNTFLMLFLCLMYKE